jgi:hypothetical protein
LSAVACLRIVIDLPAAQMAGIEAVEPLVGKVTGAFLESRWSWPKRFEPVGDAVFMLTDPRVTKLDGNELRRLAEELQLKLFGVSDKGEVALLLFEGDDTDIASFIAMPVPKLMNAVRHGEQLDLIGGSLQKITTQGVAAISTAAAAQTDAQKAAGPPVPEVEAHFRGIYYCARQSFIGSVIAPSPAGIAVSYSLVDGVDRQPNEAAPTFDVDCVTAAASVLKAGTFAGMLALPVSFSSMARRSSRQAYADALRQLAPFPKSQLAALVYDVPRAPSFPAVAQLKQVLDNQFSKIDLVTNDPNFEVDSLPNGAVNFVTLILPEGQDRIRHAAIRRFMSVPDAFKRRQIAPAVSNVRARADLAACLQARVPFVSGMAVCPPQAAPIGNVPYPVTKLPYQP